MLASFVLGLGLPTSAAYLLLAILIAPALVKFGVPIIAAHMFIFYYGLRRVAWPATPLRIAAKKVVVKSLHQSLANNTRNVYLPVHSELLCSSE